MKSLEIVNKWGTQLEGIKKCIEEDINKGVSWFNYEKLYKYLEDAETIKADLEVLEIIDKKDVDIRELKLLCFGILNNGIGTIEDTLKVYNNPRSPKCQLTLEELLKIKQWLEENE